MDAIAVDTIITKLTRSFATVLIATACVGCATPNSEEVAPSVEQAFRGDRTKQKTIFVFLDGTRNNVESRTNVRKAFDAVMAANDPQTTSIYIEGVGTVTTPVLGALLGIGMEPRILRAYDFIAQSFDSGDRIFILGFSRGAHQARALAGLIAYAGLPPHSERDTRARLKTGNAILEIVKDIDDDESLPYWKTWQTGTQPIAGKRVRANLNLNMLSAEVEFLGVWDTVPGSMFLNFGKCKETTNRKAGHRYKSDSYPPIRHIVHAVSLDEKRSNFRPILLCDAINPEHTTIREMWFPGAHADVGGGYADSRELPDLSFSWLMSMLMKSYPAPLVKVDTIGNPLGLAHWSIGDFPANVGSDCEDRQPPPGALIDGSAAARTAAGTVPLRISGRPEMRPYPVSCAAYTSANVGR